MSKNHSLITGVTPIGSSQYSSTYTPAKTVDDDTSSYWRPAAADTVRSLTFALTEAVAVDRVRIYTNSSYAPSSCVISGSNDGSTYTEISTVTPTQTTGWQSLEFANDTAYLYCRVSFPTLYSSTLRLYEIQLYYVVPWTVSDGRQIAIRFTEAITSGIDTCPATSFTVTVPEYTYVPGGTIQNVAKTVESVTAHPTEPNTVILTMAATERFESAAGNITVTYNGAGGLIGVGGSVASGTITFSPSDLIPKPDQNDEEHIEITDISADGTLTRIYYTDTAEQDQGHIEIVGIAAIGTLTHINDI